MASPGAESSVFFSGRAIRAIPWMLISKFLGFGLYFAVSIVIVAKLTPAAFGAYSLCLHFAETLMLIGGLGLNVAALRFVPELVTAANRSGLKRLLIHSLLLQLGVVLGLGVLLSFLAAPLGNLFSIEFPTYAVSTSLLLAALVGKEFLNNILTALHEIPLIAIVGTLQAAVFLSTLVLGFQVAADPVSNTLILFALTFFVMAVALGERLRRCISAMPEQGVSEGVGNRRVLQLALPSMMNGLLNRVLAQYSEIFFLGYFFSPTIVGYYALGYGQSFLLITFIPLALHTLMTAAFSEAYAKDPNAIGQLTRGMFKIVIFICVPCAAFTFFFFESFVVLAYGAKMVMAGKIGALLGPVHLLGLFSIPISMGIIAREMVRKTVGLQLIQVALNIVLDVVLIRAFEMKGAISAVILTFILTLPLRVMVIRQITGGIYFPISFFIRITASSGLAAFLLYFLVGGKTVSSLLLSVVLFTPVLGALLRLLGAIHRADIEPFLRLKIGPLSRFLKFLAGRRV